MILRNRLLFVTLACAAALTVGCSGGGGGGGGGGKTPTATATPTMSPTPKVTETPTASPTPIPANTVLSRPLTTGDTFSYAGNTLESFVYYGATPNPSATIATVVTQAVTDKGPASFAGANPYDFATTETDAAPNQTIGVTTDAYFANAPDGSKTGLYTYGYKSTDTNGRAILDTVAGAGTDNGLLDILPESGGASWTNTGSETYAETDSDGFTSTRSVAKNGTYTQTDNYPQGSQPSLTGNISESADGSGTYSFPLFGAQNDNATFTFTAPSSGQITITYSQNNSGTVNTASTTVASWYSLPLYSETDEDRGSLALPAACNVPKAYGTSSNGIEQKYGKIDAVLGTRETFDQITYVIGGYSVCTTLSDVTQIFYDLSGQGDQNLGIQLSGGTSPVEVVTVTSTIGLTSTSVSGAIRRHDARAAAAGGDARAAFVRTNFLALIERQRLERAHRAALYLRTLRLGKALR